MYLGHFAVAFAAKKPAPQVSLGTMFLAVQLVDLLWPFFLLLGIEHVRIDPGNTPFTPLDFYDYPYTHSLLTSLGWSALAGGVYYALRRSLWGALFVAGAVFSHWILDFISHRPDLPLAPGSETMFGLGLWYSPVATVVVELGLFAAAVYVYLKVTTAKNSSGTYGLWGLLAFFLATYLANLLGPPPPTEDILAYSALAMWVFVPWGYWVDRNRAFAPSTNPG